MSSRTASTFSADMVTAVSPLLGPYKAVASALGE
jgi:hypothetical protein